MSAGVLAMLLGLFAVPMYLLWVGHHWRKRTDRQRGAFWGGVIGHTAAALIASLAGLYRPEHWSDGDTIRGFLGFWLMLVAGAGGVLLGGILGGRKRG